MALTANRDLNRYVDQELRSFAVAAETHIYKGALVGFERASGFLRNLESGDVFAGIAYEECDNSEGENGDEMVRVYTQGDFILPVSSFAQNLVGGPVYAVDDEETSTTPGLAATPVGILLGSAGSGLGVVRIHPAAIPQVEHAVHAPLLSSTSAAQTMTIMIPERNIRIVSAQVTFRTPPDAGALDVGTTAADPDELVDNFTLSSLVGGIPAPLTLVARAVTAGAAIFAKVGQASSSAGQGGLLSIRYIELP